MSDDEEGEYNTVIHKKTGKGVKLLYTKSKVCYPRDSIIRLRADCTGIRPSVAVRERQHPWLHCLDSAEARTYSES